MTSASDSVAVKLGKSAISYALQVLLEGLPLLEKLRAMRPPAPKGRGKDYRVLLPLRL